jgi:hypothetical protein
MSPRGSGITAAQRRHLRLYGNLDEYKSTQEATPAEQFCYLAAVNYRAARIYHTEEPGLIRAAQEMLKITSIAVLWERNPNEAVAKRDIRALMKDFVSRAKNDPPF